MLPDEPEAATAVAVGPEATIPEIVAELDPIGAPAEIDSWMLAATPAPIVFWFKPNTRTRTPPAIGFTSAILPAAADFNPG